MKAKLIFADLWKDVEIRFSKDTELQFVPAEGMQFMFEPQAFELFVDTVIWHHDEGLLFVMFSERRYNSRDEFIDSARAVIELGEWQYRANKKAAKILGITRCASFFSL